jgi:hypothetical protein
MTNKLNFETPDGTDIELTFDPEGNLTVSLQSDDTPLTITVQSPTNKDSQEWVGGMKKR